MSSMGFRRQTAASRACKAKSVVMRGCADQPTTRRENRSMTTDRYNLKFLTHVLDDKYDVI